MPDSHSFSPPPTQRRPQDLHRTILVRHPDGSGDYPLPKSGVLTIGREEDVDLRIDHASVSRRHATLHIHGDLIEVVDQSSTNGTLVDGVRLTPSCPTPLGSQSVVELGSALLMIRRGDGRRGDETPPRAQRGREDIVVLDAEMKRVHELIALVAKSSLSVVLLGETGVGKEVLASSVHKLSSRRDKPFCKINCAALVESLLEAELFGYERGAFTGAVTAKAGLLETAHEGTLFLDELGEMPLTTQAKLLRALESGEVMRVGSVKPRPIDVRFVAATNRDLWELVTLGQFRKDLYFRLDGLSIRVPPLRNRPSEIESLARLYIDAACDDCRAPPMLPREVIDMLQAYPWPGNVRELRNVMKRAVLLCTGPVLKPEHIQFEALGSASDKLPIALPSRPTEPAHQPPSHPTEPVMQGAPDAQLRHMVVDALEKCGGNQTRAARLLGISRRTLLKRLDSLNLPRPRKNAAVREVSEASID